MCNEEESSEEDKWERASNIAEGQRIEQVVDGRNFGQEPIFWFPQTAAPSKSRFFLGFG
jgi:hypothetical protein